MAKPLELIELIDGTPKRLSLAGEEEVIENQTVMPKAMPKAVTKAWTAAESFTQKIMLNVDERMSVKLLLEVWSPRIERVLRLMLVATFFEDSIDSTRLFSGHIDQISLGGLKWIPSSDLTYLIAAVLLASSIILQMFGSMCIVALVNPDMSSKALISWTIVQPVFYLQLTNKEFVFESLSLIGGLLTLRVHLVPGSAESVTQLVGRLLLPMPYLYQAGLFLFSAMTLDETNNIAAFIASLSTFVLNIIVLVGLLAGSILVSVGLRSRVIALLLALVNLGFVCNQHPVSINFCHDSACLSNLTSHPSILLTQLWHFIWLETGEWKVDEVNIWMPNFTMSDNMKHESDFDPWQAFGLHRYYFFLGISTSGALLLLAKYGPGKMALQKDEQLLPTLARAQD